MNETDAALLGHYTGERLAERILEAAAAAGITEITPAALAPADQFHTAGIRSTRDLAGLARLEPDSRLLDIGAGLGGPARILAAEFGCDVTGIDLAAEYVRSANLLSVACDLAARARFEVANALELPFADGSFDGAWTQHTVMNIADRVRLAREARRVLRPGGIFAFFDVLRGERGELTYPLPWAPDASLSFLRDATETRALLGVEGFVERAWSDATDEYLELLARPAAIPASPLTLRIVMGDDLPVKVANLTAAARAGRIRLVRGVFARV